MCVSVCLWVYVCVEMRAPCKLKQKLRQQPFRTPPFQCMARYDHESLRICVSTTTESHMLCIEKGAAQRVAEILRDPRKESTVNCVILIMMALWFAIMALWVAAEGNLLVHHTMMTLSFTTEDSLWFTTQ